MEFLANAIDKAKQEHHLDLWAYVFMPEHVHLLIYPRNEDYSISEILKSVKQSVSMKVISKLKKGSPSVLKAMRTGLSKPPYRFWQDGGGYDRNYWSTDEIRKQIDYIHNNPVRRGLVKAPVDWAWSSARDWLRDEVGLVSIDRSSFPS